MVLTFSNSKRNKMINLVKKYLHKNGYSHQKDAFEDLFLSHPNYPSLFAFTDSLDALSIENLAIKIPKEQFVDLPESFLSIYKDDLVLITKNNQTIIIETEKGKPQNLTFTEFLSGWEEVVIAVEPNLNPVLKKEKKNTKWLLYFLPLIALTSLSIYYNEYTFNAIVTLLISFIGIVVSVFILQEKFGIKNQITSKFCNMNPSASCSSIITSKNSKINNYFNFTDLPLLYFGICFLSILVQPIQSSIIISLLSVLSIPILIYSVWLQKFQLKKWCLLCLSVSFLMIVQSVFFVFANSSFDIITQINFAVLLFVTITMASIWLIIKPVLETKYTLERNNIELNRFKRNFNFFQFLSKDIEEYDDFEKLKGITFGNKEASTQLTLILSPSCGHCHSTFEDAFELFQNYSEKIHLNILFNINPNNEDNRYKIVVENLLALNDQEPQKAKEAIIDWHINQLSLETWTRKWAVETPHLLINKQLQNQYYWCLKNEFNYTPVKIINENLFPKGYEIDELKYFINDFQKEMENEKSLHAV
jgi:uncharacterized membrane protein